MDMPITWLIIGIFVMGILGLLGYGLAVLNEDLENKREQEKLKTANHAKKPTV